MESEAKSANWYAMNRHFPCSAMMDAGWNSTQHHCLRGDPWRVHVTDENLCIFEQVFEGETTYLRALKSHVYGCDTLLRQVRSWDNNFLRRRTSQLRRGTLISQ